MLPQGLEPVRACEAVDDDHGAEFDQAWRDRRFLRGDDYAGTVVALLTDRCQKAIGEHFRGRGVSEVLGCRISA